MLDSIIPQGYNVAFLSVVSRMAKFDKKKMKSSLGGFRDQLKSSGQSKYALEEKSEEVSTLYQLP